MPDNIDPLIEKGVDDVDDVVMQQYPSPTADGQDSAPFYNDPRADQHQDLDKLEAHDDAGAAQQQSMRPSITSAEELQLAAQLSQGLSQGITPILPDDHEPDPNQDPSLEDVLPQPDQPEHHDHLQDDDQFQHQDPGAHQLDLQHDQSNQHQDQPHDQVHDPQSVHQFLPDQHQGSHLQPPAVMDPLGQQYAAVADNTPPRKRSKVSRACDECRRKKVKCDASSETGEEPCSNCRRSNIRCLFSRIPQKRGPSKGYIKELADRIHSIEGKLASEGASAESLSELLGGPRRESSGLFQSTEDENNRKRPYSSISGAEFGTPTSARQEAWGSEPRPIQPYQTPSDRFKTPYSVNGLAPKPIATADAESQPRPVAVMDGSSIDIDHIGQARSIDSGAYNQYLKIVHPSFPVLASTKAGVEAQLAQCPASLQKGFIQALYGTMQSFPYVSELFAAGDITSANQFITEWEAEPIERKQVHNLVHLQTLILIAIATDNSGPGSLKGEQGGPAKASILGRAVGLAYSMRLHVSFIDSEIEAELDPDSDHNLAIRAWWTLVMLDRWNAISSADPLFIPNDSVVLPTGLSSLLQDTSYYLARLSNILGHFAPVSLASPRVLGPETGMAPILSSFFNLSIEQFREVFPASITPSTHPLIHLAYWHCRLLAYLFQTNAKSTDVLWPCKESVGLLVSNPQLITPLNHHFSSLTALALIELTKVEGTRAEAGKLLKELLDSHPTPSAWDESIKNKIADHIPSSTSQNAIETAASQGLKHLAELATASDLDGLKSDSNAEPSTLRTSDNYEDVGFDPRTLTRTGYLHALTEARPSTAR